VGQNDVLPEAQTEEVSAGADEQQTAAPAESEQEDTRTEREKELESELARERKERARERRRIDNLTRAKYEREAELQTLRQGGLPRREIGATNQETQADSESLSLTRAQLDDLIAQRAKELAPKISNEAAEREKLTSAAKALRKELGDQFEELTDDLAGVFTDQRKQLAVLRSGAPAELIRYLTDPDNSDEADRIARMDDFDSGRALARIETKLAARKADSEQPSKAAAPLSRVRPDAGTKASDRAPTDIHAYMEWANKRYGRT